MGRARDLDEIKHAEDILYRASRPQRQSSHIPIRRDWRYATGVYKHDDNSHGPGDQTIWDMLDEDCQQGTFGRERRRCMGNIETQYVRRESNLPHHVKISDTDNDVELTESPTKRSSMVSPATPRTPRLTKMTPAPTKFLNTPEAPGKKAPRPAKNSSRALSTRSLKKNLENSGEDTAEWTEIGLVVKLRLQNPANPTINLHNHSMSPKSVSRSPVNTKGILTLEASRIDEIPSFTRKWVDETWNFSHAALHVSLRDPKVQVEKVPGSYTWFPEAVPVDAVLPPGIPLSAKEINAFYPHHFKWKGIALRLLNNGYGGSDIIGIQSWFRGMKQPPISSAQMNKWYRSIVSYGLPESGPKKRKPQRSLHTGDSVPPKSLRSRKLIVPTFDDLLAGLKYLPTGLDARGLTQCLRWYLNFRNMFTPPLELNVLNVQSMLHALRQPLKPFGNRNLDMIALEEWKEKHEYGKCTVKEEERQYEIANVHSKAASRRAQLRLSIPDEGVSLTFALPVRSVLLFPCMAVLGVVKNALGDMELELEQRKQRQRDGSEEDFEESSTEERCEDDGSEETAPLSAGDPRKRSAEEELLEQEPLRKKARPEFASDHPFGAYGQLGRYVFSRSRLITPEYDDLRWW